MKGQVDFFISYKNIYTFTLLDQIDGRLWQVQWNFDKEKRNNTLMGLRPYE